MCNLHRSNEGKEDFFYSKRCAKPHLMCGECWCMQVPFNKKYPVRLEPLLEEYKKELELPVSDYEAIVTARASKCYSLPGYTFQ